MWRLYENLQAMRRMTHPRDVPRSTNTGEHWEELNYSISADIEYLRGMARKAAVNKKGVAVCGPFVVKIEGRRLIK
jgi:hypothetical protein